MCFRRAAEEPRALRTVFDEETVDTVAGGDVAWGTEERRMQRAARANRPLNFTTVDQVVAAGQNISFYQG